MKFLPQFNVLKFFPYEGKAVYTEFHFKLDPNNEPIISSIKNYEEIDGSRKEREHLGLNAEQLLQASEITKQYSLKIKDLINFKPNIPNTDELEMFLNESFKHLLPPEKPKSNKSGNWKRYPQKDSKKSDNKVNALNELVDTDETVKSKTSEKTEELEKKSEISSENSNEFITKYGEQMKIMNDLLKDDIV